MKHLNVYPNAYYNYRKHRKNASKKQKASILKTIETLYHDAGGRPGHRMMQQLLANKGIRISKATAYKYMNVELSLKSVTRKHKYHYARSSQAYETFDNILNQEFKADRRNAKWCIDFTYLFVSGKSKRYNCTIIDLYDRRVVASVNSSHIDSKLAINTLKKAIERSDGETGMILHSDRGSQFTSKDFTQFCKEMGVIQSMSKPGYPYDNSPMERYFNTLKAELINISVFHTEEQLYEAVNSYAYGWYNNLRPHSYNGGLPPAKVA